MASSMDDVLNNLSSVYDTDEMQDSPTTGAGDDDTSKLAETLEAKTPAANAGKKYAASLLQSLARRREDLTTDEKRILDEYERSAEEARSSLKAAQQSLQQSRMSPGEEALYQGVSTMRQPVHTGVIGETFGNIGAGRLDLMQHRREQEQGISDKTLQLQLLANKYGEAGLGNRLKLLQGQYGSDAQLTKAAMQLLGRPDYQTQGGQLGTTEKMARGEGLEPGTSAYAKRVRELNDNITAARAAQAGIDERPPAPNDVKLRALKYGVPVPDVDPLQGLGTKQAQQERNRLQQEADKELTKLGENESQADSYISDSTEFLKLNEQVHSGFFIGNLPALSTAAQTMDKLSVPIARNLRLPGERVTNYDNQLFQKGSIGRDKNYGTNKNIVEGALAQKQSYKDYLSFKRAYRTVHGNLVGADSYWQAYINANPIFDPHSPKNVDAKGGVKKSPAYVLNEHRMPYQQWFRNQLLGGADEPNSFPVTTPGDAGVPRPGASSPTPSGYAGGGRVQSLGSAIKTLEKLLGGVEASHSDIQDLTAGTQKMTLPTDTREALNKLSLRYQDEVGRSMQVPSTRDTLLNKLMELYMGDTVPRPTGSGGPIPDIRPVPHIAAPPGPVASAHGTATPDQWQAMLQKYGATEFAGGGKVEMLKKLLKWGPVAGAGYNIGETMLTDPDTEPSDYANFSKAMEQGTTFGYGDELNAAIRQLRGEDYDTALSKERKGLERAYDTNPYMAFGSEMMGTLPTMALSGAATERLAPDAFKRLLARKYAGAAIKGAAAGAASGSGAGDENTGRLESALEGGAMGSTLGPLLGWGFGKGYAGVQNLARKYLARSTPAVVPPMTAADEQMEELLDRAKKNPGTVVSGLRTAATQKVPATVADELGGEGEAMAAAVAGRDSAGSEKLTETMRQRAEGARGRVEDQVNRALKPDQYWQQMDKLTQDLRTNAKPLYDAAYAAGTTFPVKDVMPFMDNSFGKKAMKDAVKLMQAEGVPIGKKDVVSGGVKNLTLQTLDYTKRALDDLINTEESQGPTNKGRVLRGMREKLVGMMDTKSPEYAAARAQYAGDLEVRDALKVGREEFAQMDPEAFGRMVKPMSYAEKDALRSGVAAHLFDLINKPASDPNAAQKVIGSPQTREKLATLFDKPSEFQVFEAALQREARDFGMNKAVLQSAARGRAARAGTTEQGIASQLLHAVHPYGGVGHGGGWGGISGGPIVSKVLHWMATKPTISDATASQIAHVLSDSDANSVQRFMKGLDERIGAAKGDRARADAAKKTLQGAFSIAPVTASMTPQGYDDEE